MTPIAQPVALAALIAAITATGFWLQKRYAWARQVSASLLIIIGGAICTNAGLVPESSPVYDVVEGSVTSLAIVWLLFAVDLKLLKKAGPAMIALFLIAVIATCVASLLASFLFGGIFGDETWKLAGILTATYTGGGLNFVAVAKEVKLEHSLETALVAADNVLTSLWMGVCLVLPWLIGRFYKRPGTDLFAASEHDLDKDEPLDPYDVAALIGLGFGLMWLAGATKSFIDARFPDLAVPEVLWLTTYALVVAQLPWVRRLRGAMPLGTLFLNMFFAVIGMHARLASIFAKGPDILWMTATVVLVHGVLLFFVAWLLRRDAESTSVASIAAVGGPSTAMALTVSKGWNGLTLPGLVAGLLGYAVGNYFAFGVASLVR